MTLPQLPEGERGVLHLRFLAERKAERIVRLEDSAAAREREQGRKAALGIGEREIYATIEMDGRWQQEVRIRGRLRRRDWSAFWLAGEGVWSGPGDRIDLRQAVLHHRDTSAVLERHVGGGRHHDELIGADAWSARLLLAGLPLLGTFAGRGRPLGSDLTLKSRFVSTVNEVVGPLRRAELQITRRVVADSYPMEYKWFRQRLLDFELSWPPPWPEA